MIKAFYRGARVEVRSVLGAKFPSAMQDELLTKVMKSPKYSGVNKSQAEQVLKNEGYWKNSFDFDDVGLIEVEVPHTEDGAALKKLLALLPDLYSLAEPVVEEALHGPALNVQATCPRTRQVSNWPASGWPLGERAATSESRSAEAGFMLTCVLMKWVTPVSHPGKDMSSFDANDLRRIRVFTNLLKSNFPLARNELAALDAATRRGVVCVSDWIAMVEKLEGIFGAEPPKGEAACATDTCRVWTLFHVLSLAPSRLANALSPIETSKGIIHFVVHFFRCDHCRTHAIEQYVAGAYGKEELLASKKVVDGAGLYWWRFHNAVSVRIQAEGSCDGDRRWPPIDLCPTCWTLLVALSQCCFCAHSSRGELRWRQAVATNRFVPYVLDKVNKVLGCSRRGQRYLCRAEGRLNVNVRSLAE